MYHAIANTTRPEAQTVFAPWKTLFAKTCGCDIDSPPPKIQQLADCYGLPHKNLKAAELLFAVHTYYALFMKLLAAEILAFSHNLPRPLAKIMQAQASGQLQRAMANLESGAIFHQLNITNYLDGDLFAWYIHTWSDDIATFVGLMASRLAAYNPDTLSKDPAGSRDLLKNLYQRLFPKSVRHVLGEYYTPNWLADHLLTELGFCGDPNKRLLDPACGSGTFLVLAINRIRTWHAAHRAQRGDDDADLGRKILANIVGFDLNPLAVMAARTNYLIALRAMLPHHGAIEIPVYLRDSILSPSSDNKTVASRADYGHDDLPSEIANLKSENQPPPQPIDRANPNSPWMITPRAMSTDIRTLIGSSAYAAHLGANSGGANGVFWLRILERTAAGVRVANLAAKSKRGLPAVTATLEPDLLYPLLRWSDVSRFHAAPSAYLLLTQNPATRTGIDPAIMQRSYSQTLAYLKKFESILTQRAAYKRYQGQSPFYSMYDIDTYSLAPIKVVWRRMDRQITAAVVEPFHDPYLGLRAIIPQETCVLIAAAHADEAHYLCAVMNSAIVNFLVQSAIDQATAALWGISAAWAG